MTNNLVHIVANEKGRINWNGISLNPSAFAETFLGHSFGLPIHEKYCAENKNFTVNEDISERINNEAIEEFLNPLKQIEARKRGINLVPPLDWIPQYCYNSLSKKGGYLFYISNEQMDYLSKAEIECDLIRGRNDIAQ